MTRSRSVHGAALPNSAKLRGRRKARLDSLSLQMILPWPSPTAHTHTRSATGSSLVPLHLRGAQSLTGGQNQDAKWTALPLKGSIATRAWDSVPAVFPHVSSESFCSPPHPSTSLHSFLCPSTTLHIPVGPTLHLFLPGPDAAWGSPFLAFTELLQFSG